jgi:hypothetical protein
VDTVHRARIHARRILRSNTWFSNYISHLAISLGFLESNPRPAVSLHVSSQGTILAALPLPPATTT